MQDIKCIIFDCMETLVDLTELPSFNDYALWAYEGSGSEEHWDSFEGFLDSYKMARQSISRGIPPYKEYDMSEIFEVMVKEKIGGESRRCSRVVRNLNTQFWQTYRSKCYIKEDVKEIIPFLAKKKRLGIISNFKVENGIEELISVHGLSPYFSFIFTSINIGWQKPHENIYKTALQRAQLVPQEILFVGDDIENDYYAPFRMGMKALVLDRYGRYPDIKERITTFYGLQGLSVVL